MTDAIDDKRSKSDPQIRFEPQKPIGVDNDVVLYFRGVKQASLILAELPTQYVQGELYHQMGGPRINNAATCFYSNHAENELEKLVVTLFEMQFLDWANKHTRSFTLGRLNEYYNSSWLKDKMSQEGHLNEAGRLFLSKLAKIPNFQESTSESPPFLEPLSDEDINTGISHQKPWVINDYQPRDIYSPQPPCNISKALHDYDEEMVNPYPTGTVKQISSTMVQDDDGFIQKVSKKKKGKRGRK